MHRFLIALACLATFACGSGSHGPLDPSPTPSPATLTFTPESDSPSARSFVLMRGTDSIPGQVSVWVRAQDFTAGFSLFRGTIVYDSAILALDNYGEGEFLKQGGGLVTFSVTGSANRTSIRIDRPSSLIAASGTGTVIALRFKPASTTARGTSALQWDDPHAYTSSFSDILLKTYGGTITVSR